jgi:hypothetical protein
MKIEIFKDYRGNSFIEDSSFYKEVWFNHIKNDPAYKWHFVQIYRRKINIEFLINKNYVRKDKRIIKL